MIEQPLVSLIDLVNFDKTLLVIEHDIENFNQELSKLNEEKKELAARLEAAKNEYSHARKIVDAHELEMKELDQSEKDQKKRLDEVANQKQYQSIKKKNATIKKRQNE